MKALISLTVAGAMALTYLGLWIVGVTPASLEEREFIELLQTSDMVQSSQVAAVFAVIDSSAYLSRQHFFAAEAAFNAYPK